MRLVKRRDAAEFFAGIGLVRLGLERAGWRVSFANDIDPFKYEMYRANFGDADFHLGDVRAIRLTDIPPVRLATASFPCVDLSLAGNRNGLAGTHSSAYWAFHEILQGMRPRPDAVMLENVVGLLSSRGGDDLRSILVSLAKLDYKCDVVMLDAVHFVPQSRPRLFVIAHRWMGPPPKVLSHEARPPQLLAFMDAHRDLPWRPMPLPPLPPKKRNLGCFLEHLPASSPAWWSGSRRAHMFRQISPLHRALLRDKVKSSRTSFATVYKRVRPAGCRAELRADGVAGCLRTPRGGSSKQFVIQAGHHTWRVRNMTAREYARLQGVPDSFRITVPNNKALFGFGDAVCVPVVEWIGKHYLNKVIPTARVQHFD
jgi:DNA (cytosine-5)-methyltransferase 1